VAVIGGSAAAVQAALSLARMGVAVSLITDAAALGGDDAIGSQSSLDRRYLWPLWLRTAGHPWITLYSQAEVEAIEGAEGDFKIRVLQHPRYVDGARCTACGRCEAECSVKLSSLLGDRRLTHGAIHAPSPGTGSVPSSYLIDKNGLAPCQTACPLGINVQGFVSLLSKGKADKALALINQTAPLAGVLGRVCTHPCEDKCHRSEFDSPVSIRALHRYAADSAPDGVKYRPPDSPRAGKIAIVGSGPAGLTAAWELTRRGYATTVFESHGVIGGMLATGIPRFRLPREVREREIEAIREMGVNIRTGITFGRDIDYHYLKERGYQALFLAIGAQRNSRLDIPGEDIDGVVDCMSLLLALNLKLDTFVGSNVAVIGGGNAAIDAARSALRSGAKEVTIFYRRTRAEMPANAEEVAEAIQEGVKIEYSVVPVEILGKKGRVTAIHCQRTRLAGEVAEGEGNGLELIPGSGFLVGADHVVVAIGQSPDASQLNLAGLEIDRRTGIIQVDSLTLETSLPGVFAGGDCTIGPNNVVEAMANGLRAAESIDRYIQGRNLEEGRRREALPAADIDRDAVEVFPGARVEIPGIEPLKRVSTYEETTLGIAAGAAQGEARRCLNCARCSQCLECTTACELGAVCHDDAARRFEIEAAAVLRFSSENTSSDSEEAQNTLAEAMAAALETAVALKKGQAAALPAPDAEKPDVASPPQTAPPPAGDARLGVFLCGCGGSVSSVIDFGTVAREISAFTGVTLVDEIAQACTEAGARQMAERVSEQRLDRVVLAACRCCHLEQVCYSCTDRRQLCQQYLHLVLPRDTVVEFSNIREQCAWVHKDNPGDATRKAVRIVSAGVARVQVMPPATAGGGPVLPAVLVLGGGLASTAAARALASRGYRVELLSRPEREKGRPEEADLVVRPWPDSLELGGSPGSYEVVLACGAHSERIRAGAILVDMAAIDSEKPAILGGHGRLGRIIARCQRTGNPPDIGESLLREVTIGETAGIFMLPPADGGSLIIMGEAAAARISAYLEQINIAPRANAVEIDAGRCRGCGDCADACSYIEMQEYQDGMPVAFIDRALCLGCGACVAICPTGAITQPQQSDRQIISALSCVLPGGYTEGEE
jgi:NADPH-dependent glutamate synthase beta subunit-like oxidoreductase/NAD-dependent dihydropyrimidine dehydrogenase PreA subunit